MRKFENFSPSFPFFDPKTTILSTEQVSDGNRIKVVSKYVVHDASTDMRSSVGMHDFSLENLQASGIVLRGSMIIGNSSPDSAVDSILAAIESGINVESSETSSEPLNSDPYEDIV